MLRRIAVLGTAPLVSCSSPGTPASERAQVRATDSESQPPAQKGRRGKDGDTVMLFMHHVKASKRAEYERWFAEVRPPAVKAVAEKRPHPAPS
jgi:hypothetical protein